MSPVATGQAAATPRSKQPVMRWCSCVAAALLATLTAWKASWIPQSLTALIPGEEQRYDHPFDHGDDCTAVFLTPTLSASMWGGDPGLPSGPLPISAEVDLEHRLLLAAARRDSDPDELLERAITLTARALEQAGKHRVTAGRPATARARAALADSAREALTADPNQSLPRLAGALCVSPHHLSRVFRSVTGVTISRQRMRLHARDALERLTGGERDLARVAADTGFADQSHLCRVVLRETGRTPSALREALGPS